MNCSLNERTQQPGHLLLITLSSQHLEKLYQKAVKIISDQNSIMPSVKYAFIMINKQHNQLHLCQRKRILMTTISYSIAIIINPIAIKANNVYNHHGKQCV